MDKIKIKLAFIIILFTFIITPTICAFVKNVEKTGSIQAKELSTTFFAAAVTENFIKSEKLALVFVIEITI